MICIICYPNIQLTLTDLNSSWIVLRMGKALTSTNRFFTFTRIKFNILFTGNDNVKTNKANLVWHDRYVFCNMERPAQELLSSLHNASTFFILTMHHLRENDAFSFYKDLEILISFQCMIIVIPITSLSVGLEFLV